MDANDDPRDAIPLSIIVGEVQTPSQAMDSPSGNDEAGIKHRRLRTVVYVLLALYCLALCGLAIVIAIMVQNKDVNDCLSARCENGGTCVDHVGGFSCLCPSLFIGSHCHQAVKMSAVNPCYDNGNCQHHCDVINNVAECSCMAGFALGEDGTSCEDVNECPETPCMNGGTCMNHAGGYICVCTSQYHGDNCHLDVDECTSATCENGGSCVNSVGGYSCRCPSQYHGDFCHLDDWTFELCNPRHQTVTAENGIVVIPRSGSGEEGYCSITFIIRRSFNIQDRMIEFTVEDFLGSGELSVTDPIGTYAIAAGSRLRRHRFYSWAAPIRMDFHGLRKDITALRLTFGVHPLPTASDVDICSGGVSGVSGVSGWQGYIKSPNYPELYDHNLNCSASIPRPPGVSSPFTVQVVSREMLTEGCCDHLYIGGRRFTGHSQIDETYHVEGPGLDLRFTTDGGVAYRGFYLRWCVRSY